MDEEQDLNEIKQEKAAKIIYVAIAVIITVTMAVSVITAVNRRNKKDKLPLPDETTVSDTVKQGGTASLPHILTPPKPDKTTEDTKAPVKNDPPATEPPQTEPVTDAPDHSADAPASTERVYTVPVRGSVIKDYTMDMPVFSVTMNDYRVHNGMDLHASVGDPVCAFTDGVVSKIYSDPMMGQTVVIDHGDGLSSVYQNLQVVLPDKIAEGAEVSSGDVIGAVGETALIECAEASHLHFCIMKDGRYEAPSDYLGPVYAEE